MPIKYKVIERGDPRDKTAPKKYYATVVNDGELNLENIGKRLEMRSGVNSIDINAVLLGLVQLIKEEIPEDGRIVRLGDLGSFSVSLSSEGSEKPEDVTANNIRGIKLIFRPGKAIKNALKTVSYKKVDG